MGSHWSKLKKAVERGDEPAVLELYNKNAEIRRKLNANSVINEITLDTYMHLSAMHGMVEFLKLLLYENGGNPNKINRHKQTVLHKVCEGSKDSVQYECMQLLLQWHDPATSASHLIAKNSEPKTLSPTLTNSSTSTQNNHHQHHHKHNHLFTEINVNAKDELENTPLHYAAMRNLPTCVQTLVAHGAYLFVENAEHSSPCDLAERCGQKDIALYLESKMIFSKEDDEKDLAEESDQEVAIFEEKSYGLRIQDLQEEKDKLLVEAADMLQCSIFTAEMMLKKHAWSKESLLNAWIEDPVKCCEKCGISSTAIKSISYNNNAYKSNSNLTSETTLSTTNTDKSDIKPNNSSEPKKIKNIIRIDSDKMIVRKTTNSNNCAEMSNNSKNTSSNNLTQSTTLNIINNNRISAEASNVEVPSKLGNTGAELTDDVQHTLKTCGICYADYEPNDSNEEKLKKIMCAHFFCKICWNMYLTTKIEEGNVTEIVCPQVDCYAIIPNDVIESLVSKETAQKYLHFDIRAFVDSNPSIKWCPFPGCGMAVKNPRLGANNSNVMSELMSQNENQNTGKEYSKSVDCGNGHYFCWDCLQEGHEPASCKNWKDWFQKILEIKPEECKQVCNTNEKEELSANYLWLVTNSKKCPNSNCNAPIQKNEGCNHVKCYRCKHDFCWICLEPWKKHSSITGGYFQCNRYEVSNKLLQKEKATIAEAEEVHQKAVELNKFVHYYTRFKNHEHSYKIEEPLLAMAKTKFEILTAQASSSSSSSNRKSSPARKISSTNSLSQKSSTERTNSVHQSTLGHSHGVKPFVKRLSHSLEKSVSKLLTSQDWNLLHPESEPNGELEPDNSTVSGPPTLSESKFEGAVKNDEQETTLNNEPSPVSDETKPVDTHVFIEEAIKELLKARRILRCSYVYGFYLDTFGHKKFIFEFIQTEFEECTENLSQIIARPHLKTPKLKIVRLTNTLRRKRLEFVDTICRGLNSFNDTPPTLKKYSRQRWKYLLKDNIQNDDEFKNTIALSLKELNPKNPWIVDKKGRHTNLLALLNDWPELEHELDSILVPSKEKNGLCARWDCGNVRAVNTLSGSICNYCSIKCMRTDRSAYLERKSSCRKSLRRKESKKLANPSNSETCSLKATTSRSKERKAEWCKLKNNSSSLDSNVDAAQQRSLDNLCLDYKVNRASESAQTSEADLNKRVSDSQKNSEKKNVDLICNKLIMEKKEEGCNDDIYFESPSSSSSNSISKVKKRDSDSISMSSSFGGVDAANAVQSNKDNKYVKILPYDSLFVTSNEKDISVLIKNMEDVLCDKDNQDKISKVCNFQVKVKEEPKKNDSF